MPARKKIPAGKKKGRGKKKAAKRARTVTLHPTELGLYAQKRNLAHHYELVRRSTLVDLQVYEGVLRQRYKLPTEFSVNLQTGVVTCEASNG